MGLVLCVLTASQIFGSLNSLPSTARFPCCAWISRRQQRAAAKRAKDSFLTNTNLANKAKSANS